VSESNDGLASKKQKSQCSNTGFLLSAYIVLAAYFEVIGALTPIPLFKAPSLGRGEMCLLCSQIHLGE
jgi:hypothetical protein